MKKLNALVSAVSLGLTLSFAVLPMASAQSIHHVSNTHTKNAHQKYEGPKKYTHYNEYEKKYERLKRQHANQPNFSSFFESCERVTPIHVTNPTPSLPATAIGAGAQPAVVASFDVPRYCDNSIALTVNATSSSAAAAVGTLTCQIYDENNQPVGSSSTGSVGTPFSIALPVIAAEIAKTFPTFLPGGYGNYGSGASYTATGTSYPGFSPFLQTETKTVRCTAVFVAPGAGQNFSFTNVDGQVDSQPPSQFVVYSLPHASYSNYAEGGYGYYAKHIKHVIKH